MPLVETIDPEDRVRMVRMSTAFLSEFLFYTREGARITAEWGEPGPDGVYEPVWIVTYDAPAYNDFRRMGLTT